VGGLASSNQTEGSLLIPPCDYFHGQTIGDFFYSPNHSGDTRLPRQEDEEEFLQQDSVWAFFSLRYEQSKRYIAKQSIFTV